MAYLFIEPVQEECCDGAAFRVGLDFNVGKQLAVEVDCMVVEELSLSLLRLLVGSGQERLDAPTA